MVLLVLLRQRAIAPFRNSHVHKPISLFAPSLLQRMTIVPATGRAAAALEPIGMTTKRSLATKSGKGSKVVFECGNCGRQMLQWAGQCPNCGGWDIEERKIDLNSNSGSSRKVHELAFVNGKAVGGSPSAQGTWVSSNDGESNGPQSLGSVSTAEQLDRIPFRDAELSRIFGGGLVPGSCTLIAGLPGVGKSTLGLQLASMLSEVLSTKHKVLYVACEESLTQVKMRANRLLPENPGIHDVLVLNEPNLDVVLGHAASLPRNEVGNNVGAIVVDSIQTVYDENETGQAGSVSQVRGSALKLNHFAKSTGVPVILISHVTKSGDISGPRVLEHIVDSVFMLEPFDENHDSDGNKVWMRATKNRFAFCEVGLFSMTESGFSSRVSSGTAFVSIPLQVGGLGAVENQTIAAESNDVKAMPPGSALVITMEGTQSSQPVLVEVQALGDKVSHVAVPPQHRANGISVDRMKKVLAVLSKHASMGSVRSSDILINVVGGIKLVETGSDLGMAIAVASTITGHNVISTPWPEQRVRDITCTNNKGKELIPPSRRRKSTNKAKVVDTTTTKHRHSFGCAFIGEVGLGGEIRPVKQMEKRLKLALKYNISVVMVPFQRTNSGIFQEELVNSVGDKIQIIRVRNILEALELGLED